MFDEAGSTEWAVLEDDTLMGTVGLQSVWRGVWADLKFWVVKFRTGEELGLFSQLMILYFVERLQIFINSETDFVSYFHSKGKMPIICNIWYLVIILNLD